MAQKVTTPLRALDVYGATPAGCIVHMARDDKDAPHIRAGEWVVVDPSDRDPVRGELFLIEWNGGSRNVMQAVTRRYGHIWNGHGEHFHDVDRWNLKSIGHSLSLCEGPLDEKHLREKIVGRILGLFEPAFDETKLKTIGKA